MKLLIRRRDLAGFAALVLMVTASAQADRAPVLQQIEVPHSYYFREMYLPQVSSGPQNPSWSPDGQSLVYSMQGSLWRQSIGSGTATQLTAGPGYDHQPDWSPDGRRIAFTRYHDDAMELYILDVASGDVRQVTESGDVNLEPRWSPDGRKLAFVSTQGTGRFHVYVGEFEENLFSASALFTERKSGVLRYYYGAYDHEISPSWSPEGDGLFYVANPEVPYGTGSIWFHSFEDDAQPMLVRQEETTWRARPDVAPDGRRLIYSSYLGRQWHQLWITLVGGKGEPFPLTYGDFDITGARWSPDGERIAFTTNEGGNTGIRIVDMPGGKMTSIDVEDREYLEPVGTILLSITRMSGDPASARVSVVSAEGRSYAPHDSWMHADDNFDREQRNEEARYFHVDGNASIDVPAGQATLTVWHGPESQIERRTVEVEAATKSLVRVELRRVALPEEWQGWYSGDVHVHMNYGGVYRNTPQYLVWQAEAEDLDVVFNLIVNKEQRVPDAGYFSGDADIASSQAVVLQHAQEFHTGFWGHIGLLGLSEHLLLPDYAAYPETAAASLYPDNVTVEKWARAQKAIAGYVHPFEFPLPDPANDAELTNALPIDAALGMVDYYEVVGFADHRASAEIWYRLLNCGFRISAAGGTDAMANFASLRGPIGMNRTYVFAPDWPIDPNARRDMWLDGLRAGKSIATNGPLLGLSVNEEGPGTVLSFSEMKAARYSGFMRSAVPLDKLELVLNGEVVRELTLSEDRMSADFAGSIEIARSSWLLLRASAMSPHPDVFDMYPYATTSPIYVNIGAIGPRSREDAEYFLAWIERARKSAAAHADYNSVVERERVLDNIDKAIRVFQDRRQDAP